MSCINRLNCGEVLIASRSYNVVGNDKRECGIAKAHTIRILGIGLSSMEVTQTQRNSLTDNADGGRSETIILHRLYSPNRLYETELKYCESNGILRYWNGYLSYSRVHGDTRLNEAKMDEIADRRSM